MEAMSSVAQNLLLSRKDDAASHSTRPETTGPGSTFASYAFGPMNLPDQDGPKADNSRGKAVTGASSITPTISGAAAFLTHLTMS